MTDASLVGNAQNECETPRHTKERGSHQRLPVVSTWLRSQTEVLTGQNSNVSLW